MSPLRHSILSIVPLSSLSLSPSVYNISLTIMRNPSCNPIYRQTTATEDNPPGNASNWPRHFLQGRCTRKCIPRSRPVWQAFRGILSVYNDVSQLLPFRSFLSLSLFLVRHAAVSSLGDGDAALRCLGKLSLSGEPVLC